MRIRPDAPDRDWTEPGVYEVVNGLYRIPLPLPNDGLRAVNVYALSSDDGVVLVDAGWAIEEARELLEEALAALERTLRDVQRFLVTHVHRDHYTQAVALRREFGASVALGAGEMPSLAAMHAPVTEPMQRQVATLRRCGAQTVLDRLRDVLPAEPPDTSDYGAPDQWLTDGQYIELPGRQVQVVATPGHTRGHVVFADEANQLLFAGDHVLPRITPSIGFEPDRPPLPLSDFLESLRLVRGHPDRMLLPAHGPIGPSVHARVDELLDHHARRLEQIAGTVPKQGTTAYEAAHHVGWARRDRRFAELDPFNQMLAAMETAAHLDLLVHRGMLTSSEDSAEVCIYRPL